MSASKKITRREFIKGAAGVAGLFALGGLPLRSFTNPGKITRNMPATTAGVEKARAWCMVIDMKRCDGCVTLDVPPQCTQACIAGHFVPKGQEWIKIYTQQLPGGGTYFQPTPCYQCENAPCVNVCPVAATYQDKTGVVLIDHDRCIGCRMCMAACPYQRRFFNWGTPQIPAEAFAAEYTPLDEGPAVKGTVIKCSFCAHLLADGKLPNCITGCPQKALYMGDLNGDIASNGGVVVKLSKFLDENNAYRYKQDLGTQPRVYYLPGYGQEVGRKPDDPRKLKPAVWSWGGEGYDKKIGIWPWGETPK